jgi:hypothetical protein
MRKIRLFSLKNVKCKGGRVLGGIVGVEMIVRFAGILNKLSELESSQLLSSYLPLIQS